ncbi:MAG: TetR/AcrR family transcriptional regulator [Actinobacteria bacterium]|nr:TetR/AcrR family transcriptional regulator [Actinomycetota bacterium]
MIMSALREASRVRGAEAPGEAIESGSEAGVEERILDAALVCLARFGVAKTTLDDVAREAGCARATVYRYFASKAALLGAAADGERERISAAVDAAGASADTLGDALSAMLLTAARELSAQEALQRVLEVEPEAILLHLAFEGCDRTLAFASLRFAPTLTRFLPSDKAARAAEWSTRVLFAYLHPSGAPISMTDEDSVRDLVRRLVLPAFVS